MTRILIAADLHIGASHLTSLDEQKATLAEIVEITRRERATAVVICGDVTHFAQATTKVLDAVGQFFTALDLLGCEVVVTAGNHDPGLPSVAQHFRGRVHAITQPPRETIKLRGFDVAPLPYLPDSYLRAAGEGNATKDEIARRLTSYAEDILRGYLAQRRPGVPLVAVGHGTIAGSVTSSGWSFGFIPGTEWIINIATLDEFDLAAFGHIHRPADITPTVFIPGSTLPLDFSETEQKRVLVAELTPSVAKSVKSVPLTTAPQVTTVTIDGRERVEEFLRAVTSGGPVWPAARAAKVRVQLRVDEATAREYPPSRISEALYKAGASLVQVELDVERPDRARDASVTSALTPLGALERYLDGRADLGGASRTVISEKGLHAVELLRATDRAGVIGGDLALRAIEAHDFIAVADARIEFDGHGVYALQGRNGAGKSTLGMEVLRYSLFGESRAGAERVIRHGADVAHAAVELEDATGARYRVVRTTKRGSRGPVTTLDVLVLQDNPTATMPGWHPLSSGKIASGEEAIAKILGDLDLDTLTAANLAPQRGADRFTRGRAEERKTLLAQAAGLKVYDELAEVSRAQLTASERSLDVLYGRAEPLRQQIALVAALDRELVGARTAHQEAERLVPIAEEKAAAAAAALDTARTRAAEYERIEADAQRVDVEITRLDAEQADWARKKDVADRILGERAKYEGAKAALADVRAEITGLEEQHERDLVAQADHDRAERLVANGQRELMRVTAERVRERDRVGALIESAEKQERRLVASECPVIDRIGDGALRACTFLRDARGEVAGMEQLGDLMGTLAEPGEAETVLINAIAEIVVPPAPNTSLTTGALRAARARAKSLEADVAVGEKIARAEEVVAQFVDASNRIGRDRAMRESDRFALAVELRKVSPKPSVSNAVSEKMNADGQLANARKLEREFGMRVASIEGQVQALTAAREQLASVETAITATATDVATWKELAGAWKACRVLTLESSVIPAVEHTANEVLRLFPHGLQIAFTTQREKRDGAQAETLDIAVLGGKGDIYEACSGGEQTTIDLATHIAISIVVSRRSAMRLKFLVIDEPEFLDEPSRAAFAGVMRWLNEQHGITCLVVSHMADLVDALGGQRIDVVPGVDGSTVVVV